MAEHAKAAAEWAWESHWDTCDASRAVYLAGLAMDALEDTIEFHEQLTDIGRSAVASRVRAYR
jgi:hypothetical protein